MSRPVSNSRVALGIVVASFVLLAFWVEPFPWAGQSASILSEKLGLDPFPSFTNPVYGWLVKVVAALFGAGTFYALNLVSALCGAMVLGLVFVLVYRASWFFNVDNSFSSAVMHRVQIACGAVSALYLFACFPFWMASTRAHPLTFDLLLLLVAFYLAASFTGKAGLSRMYLAVLLYGVAIVEFSTAILFAPFFGALVLAMLAHARRLTTGTVARLFAFVLLGLSLYLVQAGLYMATPAYDWREFKGFHQVLWYLGLEHYRGFTRGLPRVGWLSLFLVSFLPWIITGLFRVPGGPTRERGALFGAISLNLVLLVLAFVLLRDFPLAPANITGTGRLYLTPYVLIALWTGNVFAFWLVLLFRVRRFERPWAKKARRAAGFSAAVAVPAWVLFNLAAEALPRARDPAGRLLNEFAVTVVDTAQQREWLITSTPLDDQIGLELWRRGLPLNLLRMDYGRSAASMKYVASLFVNKPRLQSLAQVGMEPLLEEWLAGEMKDPSSKVGMMILPDLWLMMGYEPVPRLVLYEGAAPDAPPDLEALMAETLAFEERYIEPVLDAASRSDAGPVLTWVAAHFSRLANNLGVYMEDHGRPEDAFQCYRLARRAMPDNLSALMNLYVLAQQQKYPEFGEIEADLNRETEGLEGRVQAISLAQAQGFVRAPEVLVRRGLSLALSGKSALAISDIKKALEMRPGSSQLQLTLAGLYFSRDMAMESRGYYEAVLVNDPANVVARLGLMRLAMREADFVEARRLLAGLEGSGVPQEALSMEGAILEALSGNQAKALEILQGLTERDEKNLRAWTLLAALAADARDQKLFARAAGRLEKSGVYSPGIQLMLAQAALNQRDLNGARKHLDEIVRRQPGHVQALDLLMRISLAEGDRDETQRFVERILAKDATHAFANYMLGVHHYYRDELVLAESAYRASLASRRSPEALNDLAYVINAQNRPEEAEPLVRESLELNSRNAAAWDTLGGIMRKLKKLPEAEEAIMKSLELRPNMAGVLLNLALLYEDQDKRGPSRDLAIELGARLNELSPADQTRLRELTYRLERKL